MNEEVRNAVMRPALHGTRYTTTAGEARANHAPCTLLLRRRLVTPVVVVAVTIFIVHTNRRTRTDNSDSTGH